MDNRLKSLNPRTIIMKPNPTKLLKVKAGQDWAALTDKLRKGKPITAKKGINNV